MRAGLEAEPIAIAGVSIPNVFFVNLRFCPDMEYFVWVHYLSKFLDYFDTLFICLKKNDRQFSFLHVYHHASIGPIWGLLLYIGYGIGTTGFGAMINSFVHVLMYTHYLVSSFKIENPFKQIITSMQIFQFYMCILHAAVVSLTSLEQQIPRWLALIQFFYHLTMVALFTNFATKTYSGEGKGAAPATAAKSSKSRDGDSSVIVNGEANGHTNGKHTDAPATPAAEVASSSTSSAVSASARRRIRAGHD